MKSVDLDKYKWRYPVRTTVKIFDADVPVFIEGHGPEPLLIVGPADLFRKNHLLPDEMKALFTLYFVDLFSSTIALDADAASLIKFTDFVTSIDSIRDQLHLDTVGLFAHSALGILAYEYALKYPEKTRYLLLVSAPPIWTPYKKNESDSFFLNNADEARKQLYQLDQNNLVGNPGETQQEQFVRRYLSNRALFFYHSHDEVLNNMWQEVSHCMPLIHRYFELIREYDIRNQAKVTVPVFLGLGLHDASVPYYTWVEDVKEISDGAICYIFTDSAHYPMLEEKEHFVEQLKVFIDSIANQSIIPGVTP